MTATELDALLASRIPHECQIVSADGGFTPAWCWAHELCYDDGEPPNFFLPGALFDLLPGVKVGPRAVSTLLAGVPPGYAPDPNAGDFTAYYASEGAAREALASAASRYREGIA